MSTGKNERLEVNSSQYLKDKSSCGCELLSLSRILRGPAEKRTTEPVLEMRAMSCGMLVLGYENRMLPMQFVQGVIVYLILQIVRCEYGMWDFEGEQRAVFN